MQRPVDLHHLLFFAQPVRKMCPVRKVKSDFKRRLPAPFLLFLFSEEKLRSLIIAE